MFADEYVIPEGAIIVLCSYGVHRNPDYWERPNEFYPEHFLPEAVAKRPKYSFVPFSAGPRKCPGKLLRTRLIHGSTRVPWNFPLIDSV